MTVQPPGWHPDPADGNRQRWWDGSAWSSHVARDGVSGVEPPPSSHPLRRRTSRLPTWAWILIGTAAVIAVLFLAPLIAPIALVVLITGIVALAKGTRTWLRLGSRKSAVGVTSAAAIVLLVTGSISAASLPSAFNDAGDAVRSSGSLSPTEQRTPEEPSSSPTPTPTPTPVTSTREESVTEVVPFTETRVDDASLASGQTQIRTPGVNGERTLTYVVRSIDGKEVSRELISDVVTTQPTTQVVANGTYVAPPPPPPAPAPAPPAGNCDPNYADACVPISSDVDCAGGSGNGPAYFDGVARIVGQDVYDLDRDGDGLACETG